MRPLAAFLLGRPALAGLLFLASATGVRAAPVESPATKLRDLDRVLVIAHRGCVGPAPEVSVASIHACAGKGIDGIELDIRKSKDGVLVSIHDATLERTTNGKGRVADHTADELRQLRLRMQRWPRSCAGSAWRGTGRRGSPGLPTKRTSRILR